MPTLKRQKADGSWEYIQLTGEDMTQLSSDVANNSDKIGILTELETTDKSDLVHAINEVKNQGGDSAELQRLASEDARLRQLNANLQREVAYLNLKQDASDRINAPNTFADDLNGNSFGITFDEASSTNIVQRDGGLLMLESTQTTETVTDATVVDQAYDTSGNGGRKLVRLSNGWKVAVVKTTDYFYFYKTEKGDWSDKTQLCFIYNTSINANDISIMSKGTFVYVVFGYYTTDVSGLVFNATTVTNVNQWGVNSHVMIDSSQSALGNVSLAINEEGTELHATWSSKNSSYPYSFNIRYAKGAISEVDGSVTWGSAEQLTKFNNNSQNFTSPSIVLDSNGYPHILTSWVDEQIYTITKAFSSTDLAIGGTGWGNSLIYNGGSYTQSSPSAIFVPQSVNGLPNGRIWVAWHGLDSVNTGATNIRVSYSDDGGVTWSSMQNLTNQNLWQQSFPSITANKTNKIQIVWEGGVDSYADLRKISFANGVWGSITDIKTSTTNSFRYPSTLFDPTFSLDFSEPLLIYQDNENNKVGFYGTWTTGSEAPTLTGTAVYDLPSTDYVGAFVQREGNVEIDAYINDVLMDESLEDNEYMFTQSLDAEAAVKLRLELSRADTSGGNGDKVTRILGGIS
jgi:hypothetical protein